MSPRQHRYVFLRYIFIIKGILRYTTALISMNHRAKELKMGPQQYPMIKTKPDSTKTNLWSWEITVIAYFQRTEIGKYTEDFVSCHRPS
ncbi:hypothetical protein TWF594_000749 [Orbilia oligospora]|nr:hypothetical protein TWF706_001076 [Orbilia oligospora]KAF3127153.1 hypothetical protein TWF594_000749 [Orbilia oligospora]